MVNRTSILCMCYFLASCASKPYSISYLPVSSSSNSNSNFVMLTENQEPDLIQCENIENEMVKFKDDNYVVLGTSSFNSKLRTNGHSINQAKKIGATHILLSRKYIQTKTNSTTIKRPPNSGFFDGTNFYPDPTQSGPITRVDKIKIYQHIAVYMTKLK